MNNDILDSNCLYVNDEEGNEQKMTILFTFDSPDYNASYVVFQDPLGAEDQVYAARYDDQGSLLPIESDEEWDMVEEVINTFAQDEEDAQG
jgi:uncharacterized protein YrzB (UPF0473 family)